MEGVLSERLLFRFMQLGSVRQLKPATFGSTIRLSLQIYPCRKIDLELYFQIYQMTALVLDTPMRYS
jgi:hypothetical protein